MTSQILSRILSHILLGLAFILMGGIAQAEEIKIVAFGDSLVAGYGLPKKDGFTQQLQRSINQRHKNITIINAGISGDTMAGGAARIKRVLANKPDGIIITLGGNDALRGLPVQNTRQNLDRILQIIGAEEIPILVTGMLAPLTMGKEYGKDFQKIFPEAIENAKNQNAKTQNAKTLGAEIYFYPFFLEGVALMPELNQDDRIHPNKDGVGVIVENITPSVEILIKAIK